MSKAFWLKIYYSFVNFRKIDPQFSLIEHVNSIGFFDLTSNDDAPLSDLEDAVDSWQKHPSNEAEEVAPSSLEEKEEWP